MYLSRRDFLKASLIGTAGIAAAAFSACADESEAMSSAVTAEKAAEAVANQDTAVVEQEIVQAETLAEKIVVQVGALDDYGPWDSSFGDGISGAIKYEVYQSLADRNGFGTEMKNVLMESYTKVDEYTYEVKLRDGIYDHAGNKFDASDYVYSVQGYIEKGEASIGNKVAAVEAIDELNFRIQFIEGAIFNTFDMFATQMRAVTKAAMEASEDAMATTPVGTGPYKCTEYVPASKMVLELDENYWMPAEQREANVAMANVKVIQCDVLTETSAISVALQNGSVDISESVNTQDLPSFREGGAYSEGMGVYSCPTTSTNILAFNSGEGKLLSDKNLRKAIFWAIDTDLIRQSINGGNNAFSAVLGGPTYGDYQEQWATEDYYPGYDLEIAKAALAESAYPNGGITLNLNYIGSGGTSEDIGVIMQAQLAQLNIDLQLNGLPFGQFITAEHTGDWDFVIANLSSTGDLVNVWTNYFSASLNGGATKNFVVDAQLEELVNAVMTEEGHTDANMDALWKYVSENYWMYALYLPMRNYVYSSKLISGFAFNMMDSVVPGACAYVVA